MPFRPPAMKRLVAAVRFASQYRVEEILGVIMSVFTVGLGTTFVAMRGPLTPTFNQLERYVGLDWWGVIMIVLASLLALATTINRRQAMWPSLMMFVLYFYFTVLSAFTSHSYGAVPPAAWMFLLSTMLAALLTATSAFSPVEKEHRLGVRSNIITELRSLEN